MDRLIAVRLSAPLPGPDGIRLLDTFLTEFRPFCLAHAAGLEVLRAEGGALDWVSVSPGDRRRPAVSGRRLLAEKSGFRPWAVAAGR